MLELLWHFNRQRLSDEIVHRLVRCQGRIGFPVFPRLPSHRHNQHMHSKQCIRLSSTGIWIIIHGLGHRAQYTHMRRRHHPPMLIAAPINLRRYPCLRVLLVPRILLLPLTIMAVLIQSLRLSRHHRPSIQVIVRPCLLRGKPTTMRPPIVRIWCRIHCKLITHKLLHPDFQLTRRIHSRLLNFHHHTTLAAGHHLIVQFET